MYVCEECHDRDIDATECDCTFAIHEHITEAELEECDVCGRQGPVVFCSYYQAEIMVRKIKRDEKNNLCGSMP